jgi:hypothetical protein
MSDQSYPPPIMSLPPSGSSASPQSVRRNSLEDASLLPRTGSKYDSHANTPACSKRTVVPMRGLERIRDRHDRRSFQPASPQV